MLKIAVASAVAALAGCDDETLVARKDYEVPSVWAAKKFCGRDFWAGFYSAGQSARGTTSGPVEKDWDLDMFREGMVEYGSYKPDMARRLLDKKDRSTYAYWNTNFLGKAQYTFKDYFPDHVWRSVEEWAKPQSPAFLNFSFGRPSFLLDAKFPSPRKEFAAWAEAHPNFVAINTLGEYDSESSYYGSDVKGVPDPKLKAELLKAFPLPKDEYAWMDNARESYRRETELFFGTDRLWSLCSSCFTLSPIMADIGVKGLWYEATGQEYARWQIAAAYLRGAARQWDIPYGWYTAHWYTGYHKDDLKTRRQGSNYWTGDTTPPYKASFCSPWRGLGRTMIDRQNAYGWLIGCSFIQVEDWIRLFRDLDPNGRYRPHQTAVDFDNLCALAKKTDRGVQYTPCAILTPLVEKHGPAGNVSSHTGEKFSLHSFFLTLCPLYSEDVAQHSLRKKGCQGCLFNSPFAEFYDVVVPDSDQSADRIAEALAPYKCAFLAGGYRKDKLKTAALESYVKGGGTLFVSWDRIADGLVPAAFAGVDFTVDAKTVPAGETLVERPGGGEVRTYPLGKGYAWAKPSGTPAAKPLFTDENGAVAGWVNTVGKGRIVTLAAWRFLPEEVRTDGGKKYGTLLGEYFSGRREFTLVKRLLERVQDETLPFRLEGDVQWGVNKTAGGWLLWLVNNNGVTKYSDSPEEYDEAKTAHVKATFVPTGKVYETTVGPGGWKLVPVELRRRQRLGVREGTGCRR